MREFLSFLIVHSICVATLSAFSTYCQQSLLLRRHKIWQTSETSIDVLWLGKAGSSHVCSTLRQCFDLEDDRLIFPQIRPIQIQDSEKLIFEPPPGISMQVFSVDPAQFIDCSITGANDVALSATPTSTSLHVQPDFLSVGQHYFIALTNNEAYNCQQGMRLNVTVKANRCRSLNEPPSSSSSLPPPFCSDQGYCITRLTLPDYRCTCCEGFAGDFCEKRATCADHPCKRGQCVSSSANDTYRCICPQGFVGIHCEIEAFSACKSDPCHNGGTCVGTGSYFECHCSAGFEGRQCEINRNECEGITCSDHGFCVDRDNQYSCICYPGYYGTNCELQYPRCDTQCKHGGVCVVSGSAFPQCECPLAFAGPLCEQKLNNICDHGHELNPCQNNASCVRETNPLLLEKGKGYSCECAPGFTDTENDTPPCEQTGRVDFL